MTTEPKNWKEAFDKNFGDCKLGTTPERCLVHDKEIKSFISSLLAAQREEIAGKTGELRRIIYVGPQGGLKNKIRKEALDDVLVLLSSLRQNLGDGIGHLPICNSGICPGCVKVDALRQEGNSNQE